MNRLKTSNDFPGRERYGFLFLITVVYLALEYGRPQDMILGLSALHLPRLSVILLGLGLILTGRIKFMDQQTQLLMLLLGLMIIQVPFARNNYVAFHMTKGMIITFVLYLAIVSLSESFVKLETLLKAWLGIHVFLAIHGIMQDGRGIGGFLHDENDFSVALNTVIPISFFLARASQKRTERFLLLCATAVFILASISTLSRGGFIGLFAVGLYCIIYTPNKVRWSPVIGALLLIVILVPSSQYWKEMGTIIKDDDSRSTKEQRLYIWRAGMRMFMDNPIVGVGPGNFNWNIHQYEPEGGFYGRSYGGRAAHSLYVTVLSELGIVGATLFVWMLYACRRDLKYILRRRRIDRQMVAISTGDHILVDELMQRKARKCQFIARALSGSMVGFLVSSLFLSTLYYPIFWTVMALIVSLKKNHNNLLAAVEKA